MDTIDGSYVKGVIYIVLRMVDEGRTCTVDAAALHVQDGDLFDWLETFGPREELRLYKKDVAATVTEALGRYNTEKRRARFGIERCGFLYVALLAAEVLEQRACEM